MGLLNTCAKCGCEDNFLTTPPPCPTAIACPTEECSEVQYAKCIAYTGSNIECNNDIVVPTDTNMAAAINNIVDYFCSVTTVPTAILCDTDVVVAANTVIIEALRDTISYFCTATTMPAIISCNSTTVVAANTPVVTALENIVDYFCDITTTSQDIICGRDIVVAEGSSVIPAFISLTDYFCAEIANVPTTSVVGGTGISVTSNTVGTNTAYTVNATGVKKYVDTFQSVFGAAVFTVLGSDLIACGLLDDPACSNGQLVQLPTDLIINIYHKPSGSSVWSSTSIVTPGQPGVFFEINPTTGNILFTFNLPLVSPAADVRIVILG